MRCIYSFTFGNAYALISTLNCNPAIQPRFQSPQFRVRVDQVDAFLVFARSDHRPKPPWQLIINVEDYAKQFASMRFAVRNEKPSVVRVELGFVGHQAFAEVGYVELAAFND